MLYFNWGFCRKCIDESCFFSPLWQSPVVWLVSLDHLHLIIDLLRLCLISFVCCCFLFVSSILFCLFSFSYLSVGCLSNFLKFNFIYSVFKYISLFRYFFSICITSYIWKLLQSKAIHTLLGPGRYRNLTSLYSLTFIIYLS